MFLSRRSEPAEQSSASDAQTARDLQDTLRAHSEECAGMAANMTGVNRNIIIVNMGLINMKMFNPVITEKSGSYMTEEGCLSLTGTRPVERFENITVEYQDMLFMGRRADGQTIVRSAYSLLMPLCLFVYFFLYEHQYKADEEQRAGNPYDADSES